MVSIVTGNGAGLFNSSRDVLGAGGELGQAQTGRAGERVTVNALNGNLVVQRRDEFLAGVGPDVDLFRTYNSAGGWDGDNNDGWRIAYYRRVSLVTGTLNAAGSTAKRIDADGTERTYTSDGVRYVSNQGGGQYDTLSFDAPSQTWTWADGDSGVQETYTLRNGQYLLASVKDAEGNLVKVDYDAAGHITRLGTYKAGSTTADETVTLTYVGDQLSSLTTSYQDGAQLKTRSITSYSYHAADQGLKAGKLKSVTTDLTPDVAGVADGKIYVVTYDYDANGRLSSIAQTDGSQLTVEYDSSGRVLSVKDDQNRQTSFSYDTAQSITIVKDALNQTTRLKYGATGELLEISGAMTGGTAYTQTYGYTAAGDLRTVTNAKGETTTFDYDATSGGGKGAWTRRTDAAGNVTERTYSASGLLSSETLYRSVPKADPATTYFIYDEAGGKRRLTHAIGPDRLLTRYGYNAAGQVNLQLKYAVPVTFINTPPNVNDVNAFLGAGGPGRADENVSVMAYEYDLRGNLSKATTYASASYNATTDGYDLAGASSAFTTYDASGRLLRQEDGSGVVLGYAYDGLGRLLKSTDTNNVQTLYSYDDQGRKTSVQLDGGLTTVQVFDTLGHLVSSEVLGSVSQASQGKTQYDYDALGRLWRVKDATGVAAYSLYESSGRKSADIAANGQLTEYFYDAAGRVIQTVAYANALSATALAAITSTTAVAGVRPANDAARDRITTAYYDTADRLAGTLDADGYLTEYKYDGTSALTSEIRYETAVAVTRLDPALGTTQANSPAMTRPPASRMTRDRTTLNFYDAVGRLAARIDGEGGLTVWTYDASGRMLTQLRRSSVLIEAQRTGATTASLHALGPLADDEFTQWIYDGQGRQIAMLDGEGHMTEYTYDAAGRLQDTRQYLKQALQPVVTGASGVTLNRLKRAQLAALTPTLGTPLTATRRYNNLGLLERETAVDGTVTYYQYDRLQRLTTVTRAEKTDERVQLLGYDDWGRLNSNRIQGDATGVSSTFDGAGRRLSTTDARGYTTYYYYDDAGRQVYAILWDPERGGEVTETLYSSFSEVSASVTYSQRLSLDYVNGTNGQTAHPLQGGKATAALRSEVDTHVADASRDNRQRLSYNRRGLVQQAIDALGYKTETTYNAFGQVDTITADATLTGGITKRVGHTQYYDRRGLQVGRIRFSDDISYEVEYAFDALGRLTWTSERGDDAYVYLRETGSGRKVKLIDASGATVTTTYDALDRVISRTDRNGNIVSYVHDAVNRKVTLTTAEGIQLVTESNRHGQVYKVTDGIGATTTYAYDTHGNLQTVTDALGNVTKNTYDLNDNLLQVIQGLKSNGSAAPTDDGSATTTRYTFDAANRVLTQTVDPDGASPLKTRYEYDGQGRRIKITDAANTVTSQAFTAKGELREVIVDVGGLNLKTTYQYDPQSRTVETVQGAGTSAAFKTQIVYDEFGRRTAQIVDPGGLAIKTSYEYDHLDRLVAQRNGLGQVVARYRHDGAGRLWYSVDATGTLTQNFYDDEGRLTGSVTYAKRLAAGWESFANDSYELDSLVSETAVSAADALRSNAYDKDGRLVYTVNAMGNVSGMQYDNAGRLIAQRRYSNAIATASAPYERSDIRSRLVPDDAKDQLTRYVYDAVGHQRYAIDPLGAITETRYDRAGRVTETVQYATLEAAAESFNTASTSLSNWYVYSSTGGTETISRVLDTERNEPVIALSGNGRNTGYYLSRDASRSNWNAAGTVISWDMKYAEGFSVYISVTTTKGHRYIEFQPGTTAPRGASGEYVQYYLDGITDGKWHRITRDIRADLAALQPDAEILSVDALLFRGSGRVGDVTLSRPDAPPTLAGIQSRIKTSTSDRSTRLVHDTAGRQRFAVDAEGYVTETRYDVAAGKTTQLRYANRISGSQPYQPAAAALRLSDLTAALAALGPAITTARTTDHAGRLARVMDGQGVETQYTYDAAGRLETEVQAANMAGQSSTTRYGYDAAGQLTAVTRADGTALASTTRHEYDSLGRRSKTIDPRGVALAEGNGAWAQGERVRLGFPQDVSAAPLSTADKDRLLAAYTTSYGYDAAGRVTSTTIAAAFDATGWVSGGATSYTSSTAYDAFGNAVVQTDARGYKRYQVYDKAGRLAQSIDAEQYLTVYGYDAFGNRTSTLRVDARVQGSLAPGQAVALASTPPASGPYVLSDAALDRITRQAYDRNSRLLRETDAENAVEGSVGALDAFGQRLSVRNKLGAIASYTYDRLGRLLTETLPVQAKDATGTLKDVVNEYVYDSRGNRTTSMEAKGLAEQRTTLMAYDGNNRLVRRTGASYVATAFDGSTSTVVPADTYRYDARGNLIEQVSHGQLQADGVTVTGGKRSLAWYDTLNQKTLEISADRVAARYAYDAAGNQVAQTLHATRLAATVALDATAAAPAVSLDAVNDRTLRTRYDALGHKIQTSLDNLYAWSSGDGTNLVISGLTPKNTVLQTFFYDAVGNLTQRMDGRGNSSFEYFDGNGRRLLSIDAGGAAIAWEYGRAGAVATKETRYAGMLAAGYSRQGSTVADTSPTSDPSQLKALIAELILPAGEQARITEFTLDRLDRVTEKRLLKVAQDHVDANGTRTQSEASAITRYRYNGLGAITQVQELAAQLGTAQTWQQTDIVYDGLGRETHREAPGYVDYLGDSVRPTTDTEYDGLGNVRRLLLRGKDATAETDDRITVNAYDPNGLLTQTTDATGAVTTYAYDANGTLSRRVSKDVRRSDLTAKRDVIVAYDHDAAGHVTVERRWESDKTAAAETRKTRYNAFGEIEAKGIGDGWEEFAEYTTLGKVAKTNAGDGAIKFYVYDANGNMTREIRGNGDPSVDLRSMTLQQASISTKLYSRVSVYNSRDLLVQTIDPQIESLKSTVTMSSLYGQQWVPQNEIADASLVSSAILPQAAVVAVNGSTPKLLLSSTGCSYARAYTADNSFWGEAGNTAGQPLAVNLTALKGAGKRVLLYRLQRSSSSFSVDNDYVAAGRLEVTVSANGDVTVSKLPSLDADRNSAWVKFPPDYTRPNQWVSYQLSATADGVTTNLGTCSANYNPAYPTYNNAAVDVSGYRPTTGYRDVYLHYSIPGTMTAGTLRVRVWADGSLQRIANDADPSSLPVSFSIMGRNIPRAQVTFMNLRTGARIYNYVDGVYTKPTATSAGGTTFTWDLRGYLAQGDELDYIVEPLQTYSVTALLDESGAPLVQTGRIGMSGGRPVAMRQVITLNVGSQVTIKRFQSFNAFGDITEERDERVADRMLAAINSDRAARGLAALNALSSDQLSAARTTLQYNTQGQLVAKFDPETFATAENGYRYRTRPVTRYGYDLLGRHTTTATTSNTSGAEVKLSRSQYSAGARDEDAALTFDAANNTTQYARDIFGDVRKITDAIGGIVLQDFDGMGRLITVTRKAVTRADFNGNFASIGDLQDTYAYDELGQRIRYTNALDNRKPAAQQLVSTTDYDALGRIVKTVTAGGSKTEYTYALKQLGDAAILSMDGAVSAANGLAGITRSGGYIKTTLQADGRSLVDETEYFGHTTRHTDLSGAVFTYQFNSAGQLARQTSTLHAGQSVKKDVTYSYYANGYIQSLRDTALGTSAEYAYDNAGNRVYEAYFTLDPVLKDDKGNPLKLTAYQNSTITYDELNRIVRVTTPNVYDIRYEFDEASNRRMVDSVYWDGAAGFFDRQTYWYAYDALNRFTVTKGRLSSTLSATGDLEADRNRFFNARRGTSLTDTSVKVIAGGSGSDGVLIGYDKLSRRTLAEYTYANQAVSETYGYSSDGYLQTTSQGGALKTIRLIDALGRTASSKDLVNNQETQSDYDADNRLTQQRFFDGKDSTKNYRLDYSYYAAVSGNTATDTLATASATGKGALAKTLLTPTSNTSSTTTTTYAYEYWDGALQSLITKIPASGAAGMTYFYYDTNGHIARTYDAAAAVTNLYYNTATGLVLRRDRNNTSHHFFYYADDHRIGDVADTPDDIQRVSYAEQLAMKPYDDKRGYYRAERHLVAVDPDDIQDYKGRSHVWVVHGHSTADFDQNYEPINDNYPGAAAGSYTVRGDGETLASIAQSLWGDRAMWYLIADANGLTLSSPLKAGQLLVIPNKVTNIHNNSSTWRPYNPGEAIGRTDPTLPAPPPPPKKGCGAMGTLIMVVVAVVATIYLGPLATQFFGSQILGYAAASAVGSMASQAVGLAIGQIDSFSWKQVGQAALGGAVSGGIAAYAGSAGSSLSSLNNGTWQAAAGRAALSSAATMALKGDWNWRTVMISAVGAGAGSAAGSAVGGQAWAQAGNGVGGRLAAGLAGSLTARALTGGNRGSFETVFASTLGNAIGESLAPRDVDWSRAPDESAAETARLDRSGNRYAAWPDQTDAETARLARSGNPYAAWPDQTDAESARLGRYENRARVLESMQRAWDAQDATRHAAFLKQQNSGAMAYRQQLAREAFNFSDGMDARDIRLNSFSYKSRLSAELARIDAQQAYQVSLAKAPRMSAGTMLVAAPTLSVGEQALRNSWQYRQATSLSTAYVAGGQIAADTVLTAVSLNQNLRTGDYRDAAVDGLSLAASFLPFKLGPSTLAATAERTMLTAELRAPTSLVPLDATALQRSVGIGNVENALPTLEQGGLTRLATPRTPGLGPTSTTAELLQTGGIPGREGVVLTQPHVAFNDLWSLSEQSGVEFVLTREEGAFVLRSGSPTSAPIPAGVRPIAHTHPLDADGLNSLLPSRKDINVLNDYWGLNPTMPRPVSQVIIGPNQTTIFRATGLEPWGN